MDRSLFAGGIAAAEAAAPASKSSGAMSGAASAAAIVSDAGIADGIAGAAGVGAAGSADGIAVLLAFRAIVICKLMALLMSLLMALLMALLICKLPCAAVISMRGLVGSAARLAGGSIPKKTSCLKTARVVVWVQRLSRWMPIANRAERPAGADSLCSQELSS